MTYLAVLCVTSFMGIFLPSLLIYCLVIVPIIDKKENTEQNSKNKNVNQNKKKIKIIIGECILSIILVGLFVFAFILSIPYWMDLPSIIFKNYEVKTGEITKMAKENGYSHKSWGFDNIYIDDEQYTFENLQLDNLNGQVTVYYLKHTKYIMKAISNRGYEIRHIFFISKFYYSLLIYCAIVAAITIFKCKKHRQIAPKIKKRLIICFVSFNIFSLLILLLEAYNSSWKLSPFYIVMLMNLFTHWILSIDKIRQYVR